MTKTIVITGATDGIGLETAKMLAGAGQRVLMHGRNPEKLANAVETVRQISTSAVGGSFVADLSKLAGAAELAGAVAEQTQSLDVLINNAGVYGAPGAVTADGLDIRFAVNTVSPYLLTRRLLGLLGPGGRVVNVSSAAQAPVDVEALKQARNMSDGEAYAQSKLAITMWTYALAKELGAGGPMVVAVNPGSLLASKMVKSAFGVAGSDLGIGADILSRAALADEFADASGKYFDNDSGRFAPPHPDGTNTDKAQQIVNAMDSVLSAHGLAD